MQQEQKESLIGGIIKQLIATFGFELLDKVFHKHKQELLASDGNPTCPQGQTWSDTLKKCIDDPA